ncbi:MAG TPA: response regulator transcription factor [Thermodesulfovibrionales bacterium]|nr:response regulator transcription factor [Thermodesulfovibrionales bacterium]
MNTKILLADDHKIVREGLRSLIEKQQNMVVVAEAEDGRTAVSLTRELLPDVVIIDISMPDLNGIEATRQIVANNPRIKVIALSMHTDSHFVTEMFKAGASGYLLKDCAFEEVSNAICTVIKNKTYLSPNIADVVIKDYLHKLPEADLSVFSVLTVREREVLQLLSEGKSTKEIAYSLKVSIKTIETYRQHIMEKLGVHSVAELTKYAIRAGLTSLEE